MCSAQRLPVECTADPGPRPALWKHSVNLFTVWLSDQLTCDMVNTGVISTPPSGHSAQLLLFVWKPLLLCAVDFFQCCSLLLKEVTTLDHTSVLLF